MADKYIDDEEIVIYTANAVKKCKKLVHPLIPQLVPALDYTFAEIEAAARSVVALKETRHGAVVGTSAGSLAKAPLKERVRGLLGRFMNHLSSHENAALLKKDALPPDGKLTSLPKSASRRLSSLSHICARLGSADFKVREAATWKAEFDALIAEFAAAVELSDDSRTNAHTTTPELQGARAAWNNAYCAAKTQVETVLRLRGKMHLLREVFYDLAVPAHAKVTEIPEGPEPEPEEPDETK